jgi:hypothetical protein
MEKYFFGLLMYLSLFSLLFAQSPDSLKVRRFCQQNQYAIARGFVSFLPIPNVAADAPDIKKTKDIFACKIYGTAWKLWLLL